MAKRTRAWVYVDGFNVYHRAVSGTPYKWLDLGKLCKMLLSDHHVERIRYFTARVQARIGDRGQPQRQQAYLRALETIPHLSIHYGKFKVRTVRLPRVKPTHAEKFVDVIRTDEKESDVNLATHLLADGFKKRYEVAVVMSNDSDLVAPIRAVRDDLGLPVGVIIPSRGTTKSVLPADFYRRIKGPVLRASQFPERLEDRAGTIRKPKRW